MKIMISYGHDRAELIRKIERDLKALGYSVWSDEDGIQAGDDWRQQIENAIRDSSLVLAFCLNTRRATREFVRMS